MQTTETERPVRPRGRWSMPECCYAETPTATGTCSFTRTASECPRNLPTGREKVSPARSFRAAQPVTVGGMTDSPATTIPTLDLRDGRTIPVVGLGTYSLTGRAGAAAVADAIRAGYRLIDSAQGYGNEDAVGEGIRDSGVDAGEILLTTKLPNGDHGYDETLRSFDRSVAALRMDVVDLYLIHWPEPEQ